MNSLPRAVACVSIALAAACGSDGAKAVAGADYFRDANAICAATWQRLLGISGAFTGDTPLDQIAAFLEDVYVPALRDEIADVRALGYPEGDEDELDAIFDEYETVLDRIAAEPDEFASSGIDPFAVVDPRLDEHGLTECGSR